MKKIILLLLIASNAYAYDKPYYLYDYKGNLSRQGLTNTVDDVYSKLSIFVDNYSNQTIAGDKTFTGNVTNNDFTALGSGNVAIKIKKLTGDTANVEGGTTSVAHGLTGSKIIGWTVKVTYATNEGDTTGDQTTGFKFDSYHNATNFVLRLHPTESESVVSKGFTILVFYEE